MLKAKTKRNPSTHSRPHLRESHSRIVLKSLSYTGLVILADAIIVQLITNKANQTIEVLVITNLASFGIYYIHAHVWNRVRHGNRFAK